MTRYTWKVVYITDANTLEYRLNAAETEGWSVFAASADCLVLRKKSLHHLGIGGIVGQSHRQSAKH